MSKWRDRVSQGADPLAAYQNKPIISTGQGSQQYLGRVIIELWEDGSSHDDSYKLAYSAHATDGFNAKLIQRVAAALPVRLQRNRPFEPVSETATSATTSLRGWTIKVGSVPDPLAAYQNKPIISTGQGSQQYLGRVIIELWEDGSSHDDSYELASSASAVDGDNAKLIQRVAAALPVRLQRDPPLPSSMK